MNLLPHLLGLGVLVDMAATAWLIHNYPSQNERNHA